MKLLLIGIFFITLSTLTGSAFDTIAKYSSKLSFEWYHLFSLGNTFAIVVFLFFLNFVGGIKKHLVLKKKENYFIPIARGLAFMCSEESGLMTGSIIDFDQTVHGWHSYSAYDTNILDDSLLGE